MLMLFHGCALYSAMVPDSPAALAPALPPGWTGAAGVYYTISSGNCAVPVRTRESCEAAADVLGLSSTDTESYESYYADLTGADRPPFCVSHLRDSDGDEWLTFAPYNTGTCTPSEQCICELTPPSAPPSAPSPPASPPLPPLSPGWEKATWNYHMISTGTCGSPVATVSGCEAAAIALGLSDTSHEGYDYAYDEESGSSDDPSFCHTRGREQYLYFSSQWNTGECTPHRVCICESTPPSPPMLPSPPSPPLPPSLPPLPPSLPPLPPSAPSKCESSSYSEPSVEGVMVKMASKYKKKVKIASAAICAAECDKKKQCGGFHFMPHKKNESKNKCQMFKAKAGASTRPCPSKSTCCMSNSG